MRFLVVNSETGNIKEEHNDKHCADRACKVLNSEFIGFDGLPVYLVQPTCQACYSDDVSQPELFDNTWVCEDCGHRMEFK